MGTPKFSVQILVSSKFTNSTNLFMLVKGTGVSANTYTVKDSAGNIIDSGTTHSSVPNTSILIPPGGTFNTSGGGATMPLSVITGELEDLRGYF